ncbi:Myo9a [Symbiodinium natans]|uniref:Myo9a protein n=1 Tax=Symbiodinium natans TaxID=878477 RepID=A0A812HQM0_9DINO|nr:Myo9a [Symbiodinium natans]
MSKPLRNRPAYPRSRAALWRQGRARSSSVSLQSGRLDANASLGLQDGEKAGIHQIMMSANPVTEALGNARTLRNDNSSRFGRFVKLFLNAPAPVVPVWLSGSGLKANKSVGGENGEQGVLGSSEAPILRMHLSRSDTETAGEIESSEMSIYSLEKSTCPHFG